MGYRVINGKLHLIEDFQPYERKTKKAEEKSAVSFKEILGKQIDKKESFILSNHAAERLKQRNITFNEEDMRSINEGINKAEEKGCKDSLILYKNTALITSVKNRTIITAMDKDESKGNIFTNIDSVVML